MKISEIEEKLIQGDFTDEIIELYKTTLNKVPKSLRCQHCYTTAVAMPPSNYKQAVDLINYGLEFCGSWSDKMRAYHNTAIIFENNNDFKNALFFYKEALSSVETDKQILYESEYSAHMMRMEMHINEFEYSYDLENYYRLSVEGNVFSQSFMKKMFYRTLAEIIIFKNYGLADEIKNSVEKAKQMLQSGYKGPLTDLLKRKGYVETSGVTKEALSFLMRFEKE